MMKRIVEKLESTKGETLTETLLSMLIAAISLLVLATMILAASHVVKMSEKTIKDFYTARNELELQTDSQKTITVYVTPELSAADTISNVKLKSDANHKLYAYEK